MVSRRYRANRSVGNKLLNLQDKVIQQQKTGKANSIAAQAITDANIADGTIQGISLDDRAVTSEKIARGAITTSNLGIINTVNSDADMVLRMGGTGHLALEGDAYESPYDSLADGTGLYTVAFDPADNAVKIIDSMPVGSLTDLSDVTITSPSVGQGLVYNSSGVWVNSATPSYNYIINGAFDFWERLQPVLGHNKYNADRWTQARSGAVAGVTVSAPDTGGLTGIQYCARVQRDSANTSTAIIYQTQSLEIMDSIPLAGKTVTFSFWARKGANFSATSSVLTGRILSSTATLDQNFASTTLTGQATVATTDVTLTSTWTRFSVSGTVSSSARQVHVQLLYTPVGTAGAADYFEVTGAQLEPGSVATPFRRSAPTNQAELAACQRYYQRITAKQAYSLFASGVYNSTTVCYMPIFLPVELRTTPAVSYSGAFRTLTDTTETVTAIVIYAYSSTNPVSLQVTTSSSSDGNAAVLGANNDAAAYLEFDAEL